MRGLSISEGAGETVFQLWAVYCEAMMFQFFDLVKVNLYCRSCVEVAEKAEAVGLKFGERQRIQGYAHCVCR